MISELVVALIIAASAVVTAAATAILAYLGRGTWRLYRLERDTHRASVGRSAVEILREIDTIRRELKGFGPVDITKHPVMARILSKRTAWLNTRMEALDNLRGVTGLGPMAVAHIDVAYEVLSHGMGYWAELLELVDSDDNKGYCQDRELVIAHLEAVVGALQSAYSALPDDLKVWGTSPEEYGELYAAAQKENASAFPVAHRYLRSSRSLPSKSNMQNTQQGGRAVES